MESLVASATTLKNQLISLVSPIIYQNMNKLYIAIEKYCDSNKSDRGSIELFQEELKRFGTWSSERVAQETKRIVEQSRCHYLDKLLMRILSDEARILAFGKHIALDFPSLNDYVHRTYVELAKVLYSNPHLFYKQGLSSFNAHKNYTCAMSLIEKSMESSIRFFLPLEDILDYTLDIEDNDNTNNYNNLEDAYENLDEESVVSDISSNESSNIEYIEPENETDEKQAIEEPVEEPIEEPNEEPIEKPNEEPDSQLVIESNKNEEKSFEAPFEDSVQEESNYKFW